MSSRILFIALLLLSVSLCAHCFAGNHTNSTCLRNVGTIRDSSLGHSGHRESRNRLQVLVKQVQLTLTFWIYSKFDVSIKKLFLAV
ncbi:hypothetical protein PAMA_008327 [Pampus argenteus]